jgi:flagellar hook assembly protein FlgD
MSNYPNPFNPSTEIKFDLPVNTNVSLEIFNIKGQKVMTLINDFYQAGSYSINWNGTDSNSKKVSSGIYFYKMTTEKETLIKKMMILK